jgi:hypothetical protein
LRIKLMKQLTDAQQKESVTITTTDVTWTTFEPEVHAKKVCHSLFRQKQIYFNPPHTLFRLDESRDGKNESCVILFTLNATVAWLNEGSQARVSLSPGFDVDPTNESDGMSEAESLIEQERLWGSWWGRCTVATGMLLTSVAEAGTGGRSKVAQQIRKRHLVAVQPPPNTATSTGGESPHHPSAG